MHAIISFVVRTTGQHGALAQLVARLNGIQKVRGSTPLCSTRMSEDVKFSDFFHICLFLEYKRRNGYGVCEEAVVWDVQRNKKF